MLLRNLNPRGDLVLLGTVDVDLREVAFLKDFGDGFNCYFWAVAVGTEVA